MKFLRRQSGDPSLPTDLTPTANLPGEANEAPVEAPAPAPTTIVGRRRVVELPEATVEFEVIGEVAEDYR